MRAVLEPFYWRFQLLGWALFCLLNTFSSYFLFNFAFLPFIADFLIQWALLMLGSHAICLWADRRGWFRLGAGKLWIRVPIVCLATGALLAIPATMLYTHLQNLMPADFRQVLQLVDALSYPVILLSVTVQYGVKLMFWYLVLWMLYQQRVTANVSDQLRTTELELRSAQLDVLWQQLKPHFLFNCLNGIRAMIHIDKEKSSAMVDELTHILRYALQAPSDHVALSEELQAVDSYLSLEKARLGQRLEVEKQIDPAALTVRVPPLLVQIIVENAIRHGISRLARGGTLHLQAACEPAGLRIVVRNDGELGATPGGFDVGLKIGLKNSRERLKLLYGRDDLLQVASEGAQVVSVLLIPAESTRARKHG